MQASDCEEHCNQHGEYADERHSSLMVGDGDDEKMGRKRGGCRLAFVRPETVSTELSIASCSGASLQIDSSL